MLDCLGRLFTYGSLFAGIGGIDLGFEWAGLKCRWQVEINPFCQRVLDKNFPNVERFTDVRQAGIHNLASVVAICGGFPCQPHSVAGQRRGAADDRDLWPEYRRIVTDLEPAYVIGENVPGIRTTILDSVLSDLEGLGYAWQTFVIPACAHNAPHRRDRVWIVAYAGDSRLRGLVQQEQIAQREAQTHIGGNGKVQFMADAKSDGWEQRNTHAGGRFGRVGTGEKQRFGNDGQTLFRGQCRRERRSWREAEPGICRMANGVPDRVDRLGALGNAVVPQQAYFVATLVAQHARGRLE